MNSKLIKLLISACTGLALIIAGQWLYSSYMQHRLLLSISTGQLEGYKADELPVIELTEQPEESYADLVARPLFIKGRKPVDEPRPEAELAAAAKTENFDWQLTGIYGTQKNVSALFSRNKSKVAKDNHRKITVGDELDGWKLTEISKDKVMLKLGSDEKELPLRKLKLKALPQRVNNKAPSPVEPGAVPEPAPDTIEEAPEEAPEETPDETIVDDTIEETPEANQ